VKENPAQFKVAVIIPVHNDAGTLGICLAALHADVKSEGWELIVVDDASTDYSTWIARMAGAHIIELERNVGVARARNTGAEATKADILIFIDADIVPRPGTVRAMVDTLSSRPEIHAVGAYPSPGDLSSYLSAHFVGLRSAWGYHWVGDETERKFSSIQSECGAIRRSVFMELGGFPEKHNGVGMEEFQMAHEMERRGYGHLLLRAASYQHHYKTLWRRSVALYDRTARWVPLLLKRKKFESRGAVGTASASLSCFFTGLALVLLAVGCFMPALLMAAGAVWVLQIIMEWGFFRFAAAQYGWPLALFSFFALQVMHVAIGLGFLHGLLRLVCQSRQKTSPPTTPVNG
jgi:glycosyltransferase involved in cell wall biosynthesis